MIDQQRRYIPDCMPICKRIDRAMNQYMGIMKRQISFSDVISDIVHQCFRIATGPNEFDIHVASTMRAVKVRLNFI